MGTPANTLILTLALGTPALLPMSSDAHASFLEPYVESEHRDPANVERDRYRHPIQTLEFFGVTPDATVVEVWPGAGWWSEILAPALEPEGEYIAAVFDTSADDAPPYYARLNQALEAKFAADPERYGEAEVVEFGPRNPQIAEPNSVDVVLTFRNVHNWVAAGSAEAMFEAFHEVLAPGGVLGVVDHRAPEGTSLEQMSKSGYVTEAHVIELARNAGFELAERAEINANPDDSADHPSGVWTLPPTLALCRDMEAGEQRDACEKRYREIGESDRMTLKFTKPVATSRP